MKNTALSAKNERIIFKNDSHQKFYEKWILKCRYQDVYHKALVYCLGISEDTRKHVRQIYNFETGCVNTECLTNGWITSGSAKVIRMAFNLYCNGVPSVDDYRDHDEQLSECRMYTVEDIFCSGYARYFWEAIKIRYPEYCFQVEWEELYAKA
ncbi:MAG: DUF6075 family protein [bacterium]|nr:DUF6075 family protein [bacterium]